MKTPSSTMPSHDDISARARELWERAGRPEGRDDEHWLQAERELREKKDQGLNAQATVADRAPPSNRAKASTPRRAGQTTAA
jgi:hypothetical protein